MNLKIICFVFGGYDKIRGTYYYCKNQENTGFLTTDVKKATLMSDEDINKFHDKLDKELRSMLEILSSKNEEADEFYIYGISYKSIITGKTLTIPKLIIDTLQRKLSELKLECPEYKDRTLWYNATYDLFLSIIKANNYFSEAIDIDNVDASKPIVLSMIKTAHV